VRVRVCVCVCYTVVTLLLHCCDNAVTVLLQCCYTAVTLLLHCRYTVVTPWCHEDRKRWWSTPGVRYTVVTLLLHFLSIKLSLSNTVTVTLTHHNRYTSEGLTGNFSTVKPL
jgi:hypothetical protein